MTRKKFLMIYALYFYKHYTVQTELQIGFVIERFRICNFYFEFSV